MPGPVFGGKVSVESFFYGIIWFLRKIQVAGGDLSKGLPKDDILKKAVEEYNGGSAKATYRDEVWTLFETGKWKKKQVWCDPPKAEDDKKTEAKPK